MGAQAGVVAFVNAPSSTDRKGSRTVSLHPDAAAPKPEETRPIDTPLSTKKPAEPTGRRRVRLAVLPAVPEALALPVASPARASVSPSSPAGTPVPDGSRATDTSDTSGGPGISGGSGTSGRLVGPEKSGKVRVSGGPETSGKPRVSGGPDRSRKSEVDTAATRADSGGAHRISRPHLFPTSRDAWLVLAERAVGDWAATLRTALLLVLAVAAAIMVVGIVFGAGPALATAILALLVFLYGRDRGGSIHR